MKKFYLFLLLSFFTLFLFNETSRAQGFDLGLNLGLASPQGEFREKVDRLGFSFSGFAALFPAPNSPFSVGLNLGYVIYGMERRKEPWSTTIPDAYLTVERTNSIVNFHAMFQVAPFEGRFRPYVEGLFGGAYIFTTTSVKSDNQDKEITSSTNFDDWAWNYGAGGGLQIYLSESGSDQSLSYIYLDLKARYLYGTEAQYLKEGAVKIVNGKVYYYPSKSKTDLLYFSIGVVFAFRGVN